ncbi:MAG: filamentous hemagglutinin N-terminal domain-containing protein [Cyanothece sp. SIO2G6]|nr:filamentous hemagglutinin N-terminal domain-containing protein [Cyanothece sp. SIO2G6]
MTVLPNLALVSTSSWSQQNSLQSLRSILRWSAIATCSSLSAFSVISGMGQRAIAEPIPDSSLGTTVQLNGNEFEINGGTGRGSNLFHSFDSFDIDTNEQVRFLRGDEFENILGRVTGGDGSFIDGLLGVDGSANLFLLDPRGIIFGENARLDLRGSFVAATADEVQFGDLTESFAATNTDVPADTLTIAPSALVFNQLTQRTGIPAVGDRTIRVESGDVGLINPEDFQNLDPDVVGGLIIDENRSILLAGGQIDIDGGVIQAPGGRIEIAALADEAELAIASRANGSRLQIARGNAFPSDVERTTVNIAGNSLLDVTGDNRGEVTIYGGDIVVGRSSSVCGGIGPGFACELFQASENASDVRELLEDLDSFGSDTAQAGNIFLSATGEVSLSRGGQIVNVIYPNSRAQRTISSRRAVTRLVNTLSREGELDLDLLFGSTIIAADSIFLDGERISTGAGSQINTSTLGRGNAGLILLSANDAVNLTGIPIASVAEFEERGDQILSSVGRNATGQAGGVLILASQLNLSDFAVITASSEGNGNPGDIRIIVDDPTTELLNDGTVILSNASLIGSNVEQRATSGALEDQTTVGDVSSDIEVRSPDEGAIIISAGSVLLQNASQLQTLVREGGRRIAGQGDGGNIVLNLSGNLILSGSFSLLNEDNQPEDFPSLITSSVGRNARGDGGIISITANNIVLSDNGAIDTSASGRTGLALEGSDRRSTGGSIFLVALNNLVLEQNSNITSTAFGERTEAGDVFVVAGGDVEVGDLTSSVGSSISASAVGANSDAGGVLLISGNDIFINTASNVSAFAIGRGATGGNVVVSAGRNLGLQFGGRISTSAIRANSEAGGVFALANGFVWADQGSGFDAFVTGAGENQAGDIIIASGNYFILSNGSFVTVSANGDNKAGDILINSLGGVQILDSGSGITATTRSGDGGDISTTTGLLLLSNGGNLRTSAGTNQTGGGGDGGNITLDISVALWTIPFNDNNIAAQAFDGNGGSIDILGSYNIGDILERDNDFQISNDITASSEFGIPGEISANELDVDPARGVFELPALLVDAESLLAQECPGPGQQAADELGALYVTGRGGIPPSISNSPATDDIFVDWVTAPGEQATREDSRSRNSAPGPRTTEHSPEVEAQQLVTDADGELWLVADANAPAIAPPTPVCPSSP